MFSDSDITLTRQDPSSAASITKITSVGNIRQPVVNPDAVTTLTPASSEASKRASSKKSRVAAEKWPAEEREVILQQSALL